MLLSVRAIVKSLRAQFPRAVRPQSQKVLRGCFVFAALPVMAALVGWSSGQAVAQAASTAPAKQAASPKPTKQGASTEPAKQEASPQTVDALWVANATNVVEFLPSQLKEGSSDPAPHLVLDSPAFGAPQDVTFDAAGDLWVVDAGNLLSGGKLAPALYEFTASQLAKLSTDKKPKPAVTIKSSSLGSPQVAAFDGHGNLWVSDINSNTIYMFTRSQLSVSATDASPGATIRSNPALYSPIGIAINGGGDLYVVNNGGDNIYGFKASTLPTTRSSATVAPSIIVNNGAGDIGIPWGLAFDGQDNLWSSNAETVLEFTQSQLAKSGDPVPNITLSSVAVKDDQTLVTLGGIAFDKSGEMAVDSSFPPFGIAVYAKSQLVKSKATDVTPAIFLVGKNTTLSSPKGIAFGPSVQ